MFTHVLPRISCCLMLLSIAGLPAYAAGRQIQQVGPFHISGSEFIMSTGCSHHSTQITLRVQSQTLWLRYSSTRWDTLVLDYKTTGITREIQSSEKPTMLQERAEPPGRGGDRATYRSYLGEYLSSVARLMDGNACTAAHPELDEVFDYLQRLMPED